MTTLPQTKEELGSQIPALKLLMSLGEFNKLYPAAQDEWIDSIQ